MLRSPKTAAVRQREYKARQKASRLLVTIELTPEDTGRLHRLGYLDLDELENRNAIAAALRLLLTTMRE
jgi:hypothetical protein